MTDQPWYLERLKWSKEPHHPESYMVAQRQVDCNTRFKWTGLILLESLLTGIVIRLLTAMSHPEILGPQDMTRKKVIHYDISSSNNSDQQFSCPSNQWDHSSVLREFAWLLNQHHWTIGKSLWIINPHINGLVGKSTHVWWLKKNMGFSAFFFQPIHWTHWLNINTMFEVTSRKMMVAQQNFSHLITTKPKLTNQFK